MVDVRRRAVITNSYLYSSLKSQSLYAALNETACDYNNCRRHTGAPFAVCVDVLATQLELLRKPIDWFENFSGAHRGFCCHCAATLAFRGSNSPTEVHINVGAFDVLATLIELQNQILRQGIGGETINPWACSSTMRAKTGGSIRHQSWHHKMCRQAVTDPQTIVARRERKRLPFQKSK
jgi:hypothetical protein